MIFVEGREGESLTGNITLELDEATLLAKDLLRSVEEAEDHGHPFIVTLRSLRGDACKAELTVTPFTREKPHGSS